MAQSRDPKIQDNLDQLPVPPPGMDVHRRKEFLDNFITSLSSHDVRYLKDRVSKIDLRTDIVSRLPLELRILVASYIDGIDIINLLNVSKTWRQVWLQDDILKQLAARWLPGFLTYTRKKEEITSIRQDLAQLFYDAARRLNIRRRGKFRSVLISRRTAGNSECSSFALDPATHPIVQPDLVHFLDSLEYDQPAGVITEFRCFNGRLAWLPPFPHQVPTPRLIVDDMRTQLRKIFSIPGPLAPGRGHTMKLRALGDKLAVVAVNRIMFVTSLLTVMVDWWLTLLIAMPGILRPMSLIQSLRHLICKE